MNREKHVINIYGKDFKTINAFLEMMVANDKLSVPRRAIVAVKRQDSLFTMLTNETGPNMIQQEVKANMTDSSTIKDDERQLLKEFREQVEYGTTVWAARSKALRSINIMNDDDVYEKVPYNCKTGFQSVGFLAKDEKSGSFYLITTAHFLRAVCPMEFHRSFPYRPPGVPGEPRNAF